MSAFHQLSLYFPRIRIGSRMRELLQVRMIPISTIFADVIKLVRFLEQSE